MTTYIVELKHVAYVGVTVEADSPDEAEALAWQQVESGKLGASDGDWTLSELYAVPYELDQPSREG